MDEFGARDLQEIEQGLLADDPGFITRFTRATDRLDEATLTAPPGPILIAVDGTPASMQAVHWAAMRAGSSGADLRIVHAFRWRSCPTDYGISELVDRSPSLGGDDICSSAVDLATAIAPGSRVTGILVGGSPGPAIVHAAHGAALLVLGGSRVRLLCKLLSASTLPYVLERATCTVAVLPPAEVTPRQSLSTPARVCVAAHGRSSDRSALTEAVRMAGARNVDLVVVIAAGAEQTTAITLAALGRHTPVPVVERVTASDHVIDTLARLEPSSQVIVCDRAQLELHRTWHGRAGRRLLRDATCPVLLTRAADEPGGR